MSLIGRTALINNSFSPGSDLKPNVVQGGSSGLQDFLSLPHRHDLNLDCDLICTTALGRFVGARDETGTRAGWGVGDEDWFVIGIADDVIPGVVMDDAPVELQDVGGGVCSVVWCSFGIVVGLLLGYWSSVETAVVKFIACMFCDMVESEIAVF
eukprot:CAMPEP_0198115624 /NCGR_PEP_ID=MMETSP1442-20131203/6666_1 /TAXON_ID= /ORGANISM="Craspedostauros australis, Strain CCMP3328" /LENGTH=153 /DNA_ID=CAMNT_0043773165 /DNA_START=125 /DNA_END=586 /DNA_ORIENTATION=-